MLKAINKVIKKAIKESINRFFLNEAQWAFHHLRNGEHDLKPYGSESKFINHHSTGQFGSGTYFSTYNCPSDETDDMKKYGDNHPNKNPNFIKVDNYVYRVDMDLYKNLYRVYGVVQGNILYTMMTDLNCFYNKISGGFLGTYEPKKSKFDNALLYQRIKTNADSLGLKCPSYLKLTRMAQEHAKAGKEKPQSFSTVFMEMNGFNGVNVCGVDEFDNTTHGSVIYDLSKVSDKIVPTKFEWVNTVGDNEYNTYATNKWNNYTLIQNLEGDLPTLDLGKGKLTDKEKMRILKNIIESNDKRFFITSSQIKKYFGSNKRIMKYLFNAMFKHKINDEAVLDDNMMDLIVEYNQEYFVNYQTNYSWLADKSFLIDFLKKNRSDAIDYNYDSKGNIFLTYDTDKLKTYLNHILSILNRDLTDEERDYINNKSFGKS